MLDENDYCLCYNPDIAPIDKALIGALDKKFTAGVAKSLQDIKIAEQTVHGQSLASSRKQAT